MEHATKTGRLTTHILDTMHGCPADNVLIELFQIENSNYKKINDFYTNCDGRTDTPLLEGSEMFSGVLELKFHIGRYFRGNIKSTSQAFLDIVPIRFGIDNPSEHFHVPLLVSPFSYSTYRGS